MQELRGLPERVERLESQVLQLRGEMRGEFSAIRTDMQELRDDIRIDVEESQNRARLLHAEAFQAVGTMDATIRRDVLGRLDRLLELQRRDHP